MRSNRLISAVAIVGLTILSTNAPALEPPINLSRAVHPIDGPADAGDHSGPRTGSGDCPATNEDVLSSGGGTIVGSTIGSTDDFVAGCSSLSGGQDEIFEFTVDVSGLWAFDSCTVPACWETTLEIREETGGGCPGDFVACDINGCNVCGYESYLSTFLIAGPTYYLIVDGWSMFAYGDFVITFINAEPGCVEDADCDDGSFCNGQESCDVATGLCLPGTPPCLTFEGYAAPCNDFGDNCTEPNPCFTWMAGAHGDFWLPQANICPDTATWVFDDVQTSHHTTGVLDYYTTSIIARTTPPGASPPGTIFLVNQALFTVQAGTCNPDSTIAGSQCNGYRIVGVTDQPGYLRCSGTMPDLPNNAGDFTRCEIDFFMAYRTAENGAGFVIAGQKPILGGPAAADDFGVSVIWREDCPPTGSYSPRAFGCPGCVSDFNQAVVCQKPGGSCCLEDFTCSMQTEEDCADAGGTYGGTGTINGAFPCGGDPDEDGRDTLCGDNCPDDFNPDQEDCNDDGEGDACEPEDEQDDDGDGVCNGVDNCPEDANGPGDEENQLDTDSDGIGDLCDKCPLDRENDKDDDGFCESDEECDNDPLKQDPGQCGCGFLDTNTDGDGVADCNDLCPGVDDAVFAPQCKGAIPTTSQWGLIVLTLLLLAGGKIFFGIGAKRVARS